MYSLRHIVRLVKSDLGKAPSSFSRLVTRRLALNLSARFEVDVGAHFRAPHGKDVCEDAYFVWEKPGIAAFGVADGVSSWRYRGVDASLFPNTLLANCMKHLEDSQGKILPQTVLTLAYQEILQNNQVEAGSSTVCLGILDKESGVLQTANLGDSGFCIFRSGQILFKSKEQYSHPNVPYQVGVREITDGKSIPHDGNRPSDAVVRTFNLEDNDLLILGTDGLFDNLFPQEIMDEIGPLSPRERIDWTALSKQLTKTAIIRSVELTPERITPREKRMREYDDDPLLIPGGNFDDVTVVAIHVKAQ